ARESAGRRIQPTQRVTHVCRAGALDVLAGVHAPGGIDALLLGPLVAVARGNDARTGFADAEPVVGIALADRGPALFLQLLLLRQRGGWHRHAQRRGGEQGGKQGTTRMATRAANVHGGTSAAVSAGRPSANIRATGVESTAGTAAIQTAVSVSAPAPRSAVTSLRIMGA